MIDVSPRMFGRLLGNTIKNRQISSTLVQSFSIHESLLLASRSYRETFISARSRSRSPVSPTMEPSPLLLIIYTLLGVILRFHQVTSSLNLRLDAAFKLYYVVVVLFLGSDCYLFTNFAIDIIEIASTWRTDDPALSERSWLLWVCLGTAATALIGMLALLVYNLGGSWKSAKQNFATDRAKAEEEAKSINEKKVAIGAFTLYTWVFLYSKAFFDAALWAMGLFEKGEAERQMKRSSLRLTPAPSTSNKFPLAKFVLSNFFKASDMPVKQSYDKSRNSCELGG
ncbi:hypothetical protein M436DRAFT_68251 [Aureobasidium namibiae CBS 147.97]|uniref:Uncharacterized protein n=1 Tax=Aureobasidium namibiae CBS 147.97 TaxID=1043004 RepID=A0A074X0V0_9PEZI|nr:uncharacterized protein M436DRAFT_68251 [Aureobasidium namibiae CBS 147.97]KEQ68261.1 hypothetical protein M436DRAFT_68251 [Aureobasidium namibiae CBS 147.97]